MKKLLLVLAMVAMASFLLVGCLGTTPVTVTGVTLDQTTLDLTAGGATGTLVATVAPTDAADKTVTWDSSAEAVATVALGVVTPLTEGAATITVTTDDGSLTATCEVTVAAAVVPPTPVAPTMTAIPDQEVAWDEDGWTYQVEATLGTGTTLTYSLIGEPISMSISTTGLITWATILDIADLEEVTVKVVDNDGLSAEETFTIEVKEPIPPVVIPLTVDSIVYESDHSYNDGTTQYVRGGSGDDCVGVTVTLSEAVGDDDVIEIRWNDGEDEGSWIPLTADAANEVFTGDLCFNDADILECELVCVEVQLVTPDLFCPACSGTETLIHTETVKVDKTDPYVDLDIIFDSCTEGTCPPVNSISFTFEPGTTGDYCDPEPCCEEECSGIDFWSIEDITDPCDYCPALTGTGCPEDTYECGCLLCSEVTEPVIYELEFTFADNVGNEFVDTWTITVDSGCAVTAFTSEIMGGNVPLVSGVYELYDNCDSVQVLPE